MNLQAFVEGMRDLGYVEGRNLLIEKRYDEKDLPLAAYMARLQEVTQDLVNVPVDVIVAAHTITADGARSVTRTVPIVMAAAANPVAARLVESLGRPGGNVTGLTLNTAEVAAKRLQLLKDTVPDLRVVGALYPAEVKDYPVVAQWVTDCEAAARGLGLRLALVDLPMSTAAGWNDVFATTARDGLQALTVSENPVYYRLHGTIGEFALRHRVPTISFVREFAVSGCLITYGPDVLDMFRRSATFVDRILKGSSPATLPVELPTKYTLAVNLKAAEVLRLDIPRAILVGADEVIE